jgi:hypothetical protein
MSVSRANTTEQRKKRFLEAFALNGNISAACQASSVGRTSVYEWQEKDESFVQAFRLAEIESTERLEAEAYRRAHDGVIKETPIMHNGQVAYTVVEHKYSDTLLIFLLKARNPAKYRELPNIDPTERVSLADARKVLKIGTR